MQVEFTNYGIFVFILAVIVLGIRLIRWYLKMKSETPSAVSKEVSSEVSYKMPGVFQGTWYCVENPIEVSVNKAVTLYRNLDAPHFGMVFRPDSNLHGVFRGLAFEGESAIDLGGDDSAPFPYKIEGKALTLNMPKASHTYRISSFSQEALVLKKVSQFDKIDTPFG